jgi:hypothetical protein
MPVDVGIVIDLGQAGISWPELGVFFDGSAKLALGFGEFFLGVSVQMGQAALVQVPGIQISRVFTLGACALRLA